MNTGAKWRAEGKKRNHLAVISWSLLFAPSLNAWKRPGSEIRESRERARASLYWLLKSSNETETILYQILLNATSKFTLWRALYSRLKGFIFAPIICLLPAGGTDQVICSPASLCQRREIRQS